MTDAPDRPFLTIVSGLPRSGTSLMMKMLEAGGLPVLVDNVREADVDNPRGYYEFEPVKALKADASWVDASAGQGRQDGLPASCSTCRPAARISGPVHAAATSTRSSPRRRRCSTAWASPRPSTTPGWPPSSATSSPGSTPGPPGRPNFRLLDVSYNALVADPAPLAARGRPLPRRRPRPRRDGPRRRPLPLPEPGRLTAPGGGGWGSGRNWVRFVASRGGRDPAEIGFVLSQSRAGGRGGDWVRFVAGQGGALQPREARAMRLPRVRFTVRRIMVLVSIVALIAGAAVEVERRRARFRGMAASYLPEPNPRPSGRSGPIEEGEIIRKQQACRYLYNKSMHNKYEFAGRHPWLPVSPDPPEPD